MQPAAGEDEHAIQHHPPAGDSGLGVADGDDGPVALEAEVDADDVAVSVLRGQRAVQVTQARRSSWLTSRSSALMQMLRCSRAYADSVRRLRCSASASGSVQGTGPGTSWTRQRGEVRAPCSTLYDQCAGSPADVRHTPTARPSPSGGPRPPPPNQGGFGKPFLVAPGGVPEDPGQAGQVGLLDPTECPGTSSAPTAMTRAASMCRPRVGRHSWLTGWRESTRARSGGDRR